MQLVIDFTQPTQYSVSQLQNIQQIGQITFIVPIFIFLQNNFQLLYDYVQFLGQRPLIKTNIKPIATQDQLKKLQQHSVLVVRGTFDHLHLGHQILLLKSIYSTSQKLIIQIKDDQILHNKRLPNLIQPIDLRKQNLRKFVQSIKKSYQNIKSQIDIKIQTITQVYGSVPSTKGIDAIVLSQQSLRSSKYINKLRKSNGLKKVKIIISPLITTHLSAETTANQQSQRQQRVNHKISSYKVRQSLLKMNNFTLQEYIAYREIWDSLIKEIYALCRIKDIDFMASEKWFQRVLYKHSMKNASFYNLSSSSTNTTLKSAKKIRRNNRQIYLQIVSHNNASTPNQQSLHEVAISLALMLQETQQDEKNLQGVVKSFLQNLLKKKGKSKSNKSCRKIRKMILNQINEFIGKDNKRQSASSASVNDIKEQKQDTNISQDNSNKTLILMIDSNMTQQITNQPQQANNQTTQQLQQQNGQIFLQENQNQTLNGQLQL